MASFKLALTLRSKYLHFPIRNGSPKIIIRILAGDQMLREFSAELAGDEKIDWWAFYDVSQFSGKRIELVSMGDLPAEQAAWLAGAIQQSDQRLDAEDLYQEHYRPQFHFTSQRGWNNDPNGLVYHQGEWHMFYQHNPFGIHWGNMHWGHAVSTDLVHWTELPEALFQKSLQDMAFSGGGFNDEQNSGGWSTGTEAPLVAAFTSTGRGECLAYSLDRGRTLTEYAGNPVIAHRGRDPKIFWYEPGKHWVLIVYEELIESPSQADFGYAIYTSTDLKQWSRQSFLPGWYECPELFDLPLEDQAKTRKWVLYGCVKDQYPSAYQVGSFDGKVFTPEMPPAQAHAGPCFYAAQVFSQAPDNRRIMLGWLKGAHYPDSPFSQGMTVPLELSLAKSTEPDAPYRLCFSPVEELNRLVVSAVQAAALTSSQLNDLTADFQPEDLLDLRMVCESREPFTLTFSDTQLDWDPAKLALSFAGKSAKLAEPGESLRLRLLIDRSVTEIFINEGRAAFAAATLFSEGQQKIKSEGRLKITSLQIHLLKSIWE